MKNKLVKNLAIIAVVLSLILLGTACGSSNKNAGESSSATASDSAAAGDSSSSASADELASPDATPDVMSGIFNGVVDSHTIEIETGVGPLSYQVSNEIAEKVSTWDTGTKVTFQFKENNITTIDKE